MRYLQISSRLCRLVSLFLCLALLTQLSPAPPIATAGQRPQPTSTAPASCELYPIALHTQTLAGVAVGTTIPNILNGTQPGAFGWLRWTGDSSETALAASLTPPGNSATYTNPSDPTDHILSVGDRVRSRPGVANSHAVRAALDRLKSLDITVPVWDTTAGSGSKATYHIVSFAQVRLTAYQLSGTDRISARFLGYATCGDPPSPPPPSCRIYAVHDESTNDSQFLTIDLRDKRVAPLGSLRKDYDIEGLDLHPRTQILYATAGSDNRHGQDGYLYRVDKATGAPSPIGRTGFSEVVGLSFRPTDATLWGWSEGAGLIQIDPTSGTGTLIYRSTKNIEALAWSNDGARLYATSGTKLLVYEPGKKSLTQIAKNLPGATEALDMRPDGRLAGGVDGSGRISIYTYDVTTLGVVASESIATSFNDIESLAWPESCATDAPVASDDSYSVDEDGVLSVPAQGVLSNDTNPAGGSLSAVLISGTLSGTLTLNVDGSFVYTPNPNFNGSDSFTYQAGDGRLGSNTATVRITVNPVNDPPTAADDSYTVDEDSILSVDAPGVLTNDSDPDGDTLSALLVNSPAHGHLIFNADGSFAYAPNPNYTGSDSFTYHASDGAATSNDATVTLTITPVTDAPLGVDDAYTMDENSTLTLAAPGVLGNDSDPKGRALSVVQEGGPFSGTLTLNSDGSLIYVPNANFSGADSFTYRAGNGSRESNLTTVRIGVGAINNPPAIVSPPTVTAAAGQTYHYAVDAADPDEVDTLTFALETGPDGMTIDPASGVVQWLLSAGETGVHAVALRVRDAAGLSDIQSYSLTVNNDPIALDDAYSVDEDGVLQVPSPGVLGNDTDLNGGALTASLVSSPLSGTLVFTSNGSFRYTPNPATFDGVDRFMYTVSDGSLISNVATVTIVVNPLPVAVPDVIGMAPPAATKTITESQLAVGQVTTVDGAITLNFDSLPSVQGWTYGTDNLSLVPETRVFAVRDSILYQDSIGIGGTVALYRLPGVVDPRLPYTLSVRARVLAQEPDQMSPNSCGFLFGVQTGEHLSHICIGPNQIEDASLNILSTAIDTTQFHTYRMEGTPHTVWRLFVDDILLATGIPRLLGSPDAPNGLTLGDSTRGRNARAEIASYSFTQPRVIAQNPEGGAQVLKGSPIDLVVATGPARMTVPNVVGLAQADAESLIRAARLTVGTVTTEHNASVPAGRVISQRPVGGTEAVIGAAVTLVVSLGSATTIVPQVIGLQPASAEQKITDADLAVGAVTTVPGAITLDMSALPSQQGWMYADDSTGIPEAAVFSVSDGMLQQDTIGKGFNTWGYQQLQMVDRQLPFTIAFRARVLAHEAIGGNPDHPFGFCIGVNTGTETFGVGLDPRQIMDSLGTVLSTAIDNSQFHNYRLEVTPGVGYRVLVDGALVGTGPPRPSPDPSRLYIGDCTRGPNARADLSSYTFTQPRVIEQRPTNGTVVPIESFVDLTVASGPATATVPDLVGLLPNDAESALRTANLQAGTTSTAFSATIPAGHISVHKPIAGTPATPGSSIDLVISLGPISCASVSPGLVSWWSGDQDARDIAGTNYGVFRGDTTIAVGMVDKALSFDGTGDAVEVLDHPSLDIVGELALDAWVYPVSGSGGIVTKADNALPGGGWHMEYDGNNRRIGFTINSGTGNFVRIFSPPFSAPFNAWSHVAATFDGTTLKLYINGVQVNSSSSPPPPANGFALLIGAYQRNAVKEQFFHGRVDEVGLFNRALSATEIKRIFDAGSLGQCKQPAPESCVATTRPLPFPGPGDGPGGWAPTASSSTGGPYHTATLLPDGSVLVVGGRFTWSTVERFDPTTRLWEAVAPLPVGREQHTATLLPNGMVLITGGASFDSPRTKGSAFLYNPATDTWTPVASLSVARQAHTATLLADGSVLVTGGYRDGVGVLRSAERYVPATNTWTAVPDMGELRYNHAATPLPSGQVLITGGRIDGALASTELYNPVTNTWAAGPAMRTPRYSHTATVLPSGNILISGGGTSSAELYDPSAQRWISAAPMGVARGAHTATLLASGQVIVAGGINGSALSTSEIYDPSVDRWSYFPSLTYARESHSATLIANGSILVTGGWVAGLSSTGTSAELYQPGIAGWLPAAPMSIRRLSHTTTLLHDGSVLVVGGGMDANGANLASAERYYPATNIWTSAGQMSVPRARHSATLLSDGRVLVVGGTSVGSAGPALASAEIYDPITNTWFSAGNISEARYTGAATLLCDGRVLLAGGGDSARADLYDPVTNTWILATPMSIPRQHQTATLLDNGKVLVVGGATPDSGEVFGYRWLASAELYDPVTNMWSPAGHMSVVRAKHEAVLLDNGNVLIMGGYGQRGVPVYASAEIYDPTSNAWSPAASMHDRRYNFTAAVLGDGSVLVTGGADREASSERYDPTSNQWQRTGTMATPRALIDLVILKDGRALVAGGAIDSGSTASAEIYDPRGAILSPRPPVADDDRYILDALHPLAVDDPGVLRNDQGQSGGALAARLVSDPAHGTLTLNSTGGFSYTPDATFTTSDSFTYQASVGGLTSNIATVTIQLNRPPTITSSPVFVGSEGQPYSYAVQASDPDGDRLTFALATAPPGLSINAVTGFIRWTPSTVQAGPHTVEVRVSDGLGATAIQRYTLTIAEALNASPIITSTPVTTATEGLLYQYDVAATDVDNDPLTYSLIITPTGMVIDRATGLIRWTPSGTQAGSHRVAVRVSDGRGGTYTQSYTIAVAEVVNNPPIITSNPLTTATEGMLYRYAFAAFDADDDDLSARLTTFPDGMDFDPATAAIVWTPNGTQSGIHEVMLEVADGRGGIATQRYAITVAEAIPNAPVIISTPTTTATIGALYQYSVVATDADHDLLTFSLPTAPAGMTIRAETGLIEWTPSSTQVGDHAVTVRVDDGQGRSATQSFVVRVLAQPPTPDWTPPSLTMTIDPPAIDPGGSVLITIVATDNVGVTSRALTVNGAPLTLDANGRATFTSSAPGLYTAVGTATDAAGNTRTATGTFPVRNPADTTLPTVALTSPVDDAVIEQVASIIGTASDANLVRYELSLAPMGEDTFTPFASGASSVVDGVLGHLDPTLLQNGIYRVRLVAEDVSGNTAEVERVYQIQGDAKVGIFTLSFTDLEVPVAGLPIQVIRTYDSRDKRTGDFGVGWTLDIKTVRVQENRVTGVEWQGTRSGGFFATYCVQPTRPHIVMITLPDGTAYKFEATLSPQCQQLVPPSQVRIGFRPLPGTKATLAPIGNALAEISGSFPGDIDLINLDPDDPALFDANRYLLTLQDGRVLTIDQRGGLESIADLNGNTLTIGRDGISHSSGKAVAFTRDGQGRISRITDPRGKTIAYGYDAAGDLVSVTDQQTQTTTFTYNRSHGLLTINDPRGIQPIRNEYDANGRLVAHVDADGNRVEYTHDIGGRQELVEDRLGHATAYTYDVHGNVLSQTDPLGNTTTYSYDTRGNQLSQTDPLGHTTTSTYDDRDNLLTQTDPLGNCTSYTYNARGQVLTSADPLGRLTTNTYDTNGNLTETRDPQGQVTIYTYNPRGLQASMTDPLSNTTRYDYDAVGNLTQETDARGHATTYTYDENGNRQSQTTTRTRSDGILETLVTSYEYDGLNRLIATTHPDGSTTQVEYNSIGQQAATIDQLDRRTAYQYDDQGRLMRTIYPDGTAEESRYDAEGRRVSSIDRAGRATTYIYDAAGRLVKTTEPDGAATTTTYDAAGRTIAATDPLSNTTRYAYDAAGRQVRVTDALSNTTTFAYDEVGNQVAMTDTLGITTTYEYDRNNRRTGVIYADQTSQTTTYDALGRSVAQTDQAGKTTRFGYDALGRLTAVTDTLNLVTRYSYDELGNQLTQTDALGRTTRFAYDRMGRRTSRTLPLGMVETYVYDLAGNLTSKTDFNGYTTTYDYDEVSRLTRKTPDSRLGQPPVSFTYTPIGQRASMTDASGTTSYSYDVRDRLLSKATAWGTLSYTYDLAGNLRSIHSSNADGATMDYTYDALNRLKSVTDRSGATTYEYDPNGNLAGYTYPNGVKTSYIYSTLNRLTDMRVTRPAVTLARYVYDLGPTGNRRSVVELSGRTASFTYDDLYQLTQETISGDPNGKNGTIGYSYDAVGNRLERTSTLTEVPADSYAYDDNDRLTRDSYDANGSTIAAGGHTYAYDFENRLTGMDNDAAAFLYDGDGNRVAKTVGGVTTRYLVDDRNPTGYAQVLEEIQGGAVQRAYSYGHDLINQRQASDVSFYGYDGHGSVRFLTDTSGAVTDRYDYDAFGVLISVAGGTENAYRYAGEQYDSNLEMLYLRARYMRAETGRFWTVDGFAGNAQEPLSLHKYLYAQNNPSNRVDPSGLVSSVDVVVTIPIRGLLFQFAANALLLLAGKNVLTRVKEKLRRSLPTIIFGEIDMPDIASNVRQAIEDQGYTNILHRKDPPWSRSWVNATCWLQWGSPPAGKNSCDEYPFATTQEGGLGSWVNWVEPRQNSRQGFHIKSFYSPSGCGIVANDPILGAFRVEVGVFSGYKCGQTQ
jgi:RHS repeat-associated protein